MRYDWLFSIIPRFDYVSFYATFMCIMISSSSSAHRTSFWLLWSYTIYANFKKHKSQFLMDYEPCAPDSFQLDYWRKENSRIKIRKSNLIDLIDTWKAYLSSSVDISIQIRISMYVHFLLLASPMARVYDIYRIRFFIGHFKWLRILIFFGMKIYFCIFYKYSK